jgi:hypothetical protein
MFIWMEELMTVNVTKKPGRVYNFFGAACDGDAR